MRTKKWIIWILSILATSFLILSVIYISSLKGEPSLDEYLLMDSKGKSYEIKLYTDYRDNRMFSIDDKPLVFTRLKPEKITKLQEKGDKELFWIGFDSSSQSERLLFFDGSMVESLILHENEDYEDSSKSNGKKISTEFALFINDLLDQKMLYNVDETMGSALRWEKYLSELLVNL